MTDDLKEAAERLERWITGHDAQAVAASAPLWLRIAGDLRLALSALKAAERPQPVPGDGEGVKAAEIDALFCDLGQLLNKVEQDWDAEGQWSAWDAETVARFRRMHARAASIASNPPPDQADLLTRLQSAERDRDALKAERDALASDLEAAWQVLPADNPRCVEARSIIRATINTIRAHTLTGGDHGE